jgi:hypothetical protein
VGALVTSGIVFLLLALAACGGPRQHSNCVAAFLEGADRQSETDEQRTEIARALREMLTAPPTQLRSARYQDYRGNKGVWNARELLKRYYLSPSHSVFDDDCFFRDVSAPEARAALQKRLDDLEGGR